MPIASRVTHLLCKMILPVTAFCLLVTHTARAQQADRVGSLSAKPEEGEGLAAEFEFLQEDAQVELASRHRQDIGMSPSSVTVITREDIEASGANTLVDLFRLIPGMDVVITCPIETAINSRMNWSTRNNKILILVDGRETLAELFGFTIVELQVFSLDDIERIEVIRGAGSVLYGANALTGVINITTRAVPAKNSGWAKILGGEIGHIKADARATMRTGNWGLALSGAYDRSGSFADPQKPGKDSWHARTVLDYQLPNGNKLLLDLGFGSLQGTMSGVAFGTISGIMGINTARLAFLSDQIKGQISWLRIPVSAVFNAPLEYLGVQMANFKPAETDSHTLNADAQWKLPTLLDSLLLIGGVGASFSTLHSDQFLDASSFSDVNSPQYHQPGIQYWDWRGNIYGHSELTVTDWFTLYGGLRLDYNNITDFFLSPRLALVFNPAANQSIRVGAARAFRRPSFVETSIHPMITFPKESPIQGSSQDRFQEAMSHFMGNDQLVNEELYTAELGYYGQFFNNRLSVSLDLYYDRFSNAIDTYSNIVTDSWGIPDLTKSMFHYINYNDSIDSVGSELSVRYSPSHEISLIAWWSHREILSASLQSESPKNLMGLGGRFHTISGFGGSLYAFSRSEFTDAYVQNPSGILSPPLRQTLHPVILLLGKVGWTWISSQGIAMETGIKLFLPISPFFAPNFRYREEGGFETLAGETYGAEALRRVVTVFVEGTY
jgi:iron complex outermembrane recepter protein